MTWATCFIVGLAVGSAITVIVLILTEEWTR